MTALCAVPLLIHHSSFIMIEIHPFEPFLPKNAKLLMLGTFPPAPKRWCMEWYYRDKLRFVDTDHKTYRLQELKDFLLDRGVAIFDTCLRIRRTKGTASDKDLEVVEQADLDGMLRSLPECKAVIAAGQLATTLFTDHYHIDARKMKMGDHLDFTFEGRTIRLYREPSSSRAYPMKVEKKAEYYDRMFQEIGLK